MAKSKITLHQQSIESAMDGQGIVRAPVVSLKIRKNGKDGKQLSVVKKFDAPQVGDNVVRIINECDPIGFLSDVVNGKAIQCWIVEADGTVKEQYETPDLDERIKTAKFLTERYMPKVGMVKHAHLHKTISPDQDPNPKSGSFDQMVQHAASAPTSDD